MRERRASGRVGRAACRPSRCGSLEAVRLCFFLEETERERDLGSSRNGICQRDQGAPPTLLLGQVSSTDKSARPGGGPTPSPTRPLPPPGYRGAHLTIGLLLAGHNSRGGVVVPRVLLLAPALWPCGLWLLACRWCVPRDQVLITKITPCSCDHDHATRGPYQHRSTQFLALLYSAIEVMLSYFCDSSQTTDPWR